VRLGFIGRAPAEYDDAFMDAMTRAYLDQTPWTRLRLSAVRDLVEPRPGDRVLDLGCAGGAVTHFLSTFGCEVVGVDSEPRAIERASALFPKLRFELADVTRLPFPDRSFDRAVAADLVEHLADASLERMLNEAARVLVPGGSLTVYTPNALHPIERLKARDLLLARNETHVGVRDARELVAALDRAGLRIDRNEWRASFLPGVRTLERLGGPHVASLRYRLCLRARTPSEAEDDAGERERGA
jgi:SAM-dependent methyltransferase